MSGRTKIKIKKTRIFSIPSWVVRKSQSKTPGNTIELSWPFIGGTVQTKVHQGDIAGGRLWNKPINNLSLLVYRQLHLVGHSIIWPRKKLSWLSIKYFSSSSNHSLGAEKIPEMFRIECFLCLKNSTPVFFSSLLTEHPYLSVIKNLCGPWMWTTRCRTINRIWYLSSRFQRTDGNLDWLSWTVGEKHPWGDGSAMRREFTTHPL